VTKCAKFSVTNIGRRRNVNLGAYVQPHFFQYKLAVLAYKVPHGDAPRYLGPLTRFDDLPGRRTLRSTKANRLVVPAVKLSTVDSREFAVAVAAPHIWNILPTVVAANSLSTFRRLLKRFLVKQSYHIIQLVVLAVVAAHRPLQKSRPYLLID